VSSTTSSTASRPAARSTTLKKIRDAGGTVEEKQPIPGQGWFAACTDPEGTQFSLFQNDPSVTMEQMEAHQAARA